MPPARAAAKETNRAEKMKQDRFFFGGGGKAIALNYGKWNVYFLNDFKQC